MGIRRYQKYIVELLGTFFLSLVVTAAVATPTIIVHPAILAGTILMLFVYTIGAVSGANLNPAITIALWSLKRLSTRIAIGYIVMQIIGAVLALVIANWLLPTGRAVIEPVATFKVGMAELFGMVFFSFGVAAAAYGQVRPTATGIAVGLSLTIGVFLASFLGSLGWLNPAVALTAGSFSLVYILMPIIGAMLGMWLFRIFGLNTVSQSAR